VAEGLTDNIELRALADVMGGEGVAQGMGRGIGNPRLSQVFRNDGADRARPQRLLELGTVIMFGGSGGTWRQSGTTWSRVDDSCA
jgi:hypothetical protein